MLPSSQCLMTLNCTNFQKIKCYLSLQEQFVIQEATFPFSSFPSLILNSNSSVSNGKYIFIEHPLSARYWIKRFFFSLCSLVSSNKIELLLLISFQSGCSEMAHGHLHMPAAYHRPQKSLILIFSANLLASHLSLVQGSTLIQGP